MLNPLSPLQEVKLEGNSSRIFLKREDLIQPGGGNKVRRFLAFFEKYPDAKKVIALSNPGSHTFKILTHILEEMEQKDAPHFVYLERAMELTQYEKKNRRDYINHPYIKVSTAPFWIQWLKWMYYRYSQQQNTEVIGIGGHTSVQLIRFNWHLKNVSYNYRKTIVYQNRRCTFYRLLLDKCSMVY